MGNRSRFGKRKGRRFYLCFIQAGIIGFLTLSCGGSSGTRFAFSGVGEFESLTINVGEGETWSLNRPIRLTFNHAVDPTSIDFGSIQLRGLSAEVAGRPVTGTFSIDPQSQGKVVVFYPACPTNEALDNGGLLAGEYEYEISLPTHASFGVSILRDQAGRPLARGLTRRFLSPPAGSPSTFIDFQPTPPQLTKALFPKGLNFFVDDRSYIEVEFDQAIDGRSSNLNQNRLCILYSNADIAEIGPQPQASDFALENRVPGTWQLVRNCSESGHSTLRLMIDGILPPHRYLRVFVSGQFQDIAGQHSGVSQMSADHSTPSLADVYQDPAWSSDQLAFDEFTEQFDLGAWIDAEAAQPAPFAEFGNGYARASLDFPGQFVSPEADFYVNEVFRIVQTTGLTLFTDSNQRTFTLQNGVLYCNDFHIAPGTTLDVQGVNPFIVYATGKVLIEGTIDVSGEPAGQTLNPGTPGFAEGGASGQGGGGNGGTASQVTTAYTPRGSSGDGPFGLIGTGGQGGEGGFQQRQGLNNLGIGNQDLLRLIVGGGGGGTFSVFSNTSIRWEAWTDQDHPPGIDNEGPDYRPDRHPMFDPQQVTGGEAGMRGSSFESNQVVGLNPQEPHGVYGMEDEKVDLDAFDGEPFALNIDPPWEEGPVPPFQFGDPIAGPDGGAAGPSVFSADGNPGNDFWGRRLNDDGTVTQGELLTPWAGSGGGASGDSQILERLDLNNDLALDPLTDFFPESVFPPAIAGSYRKGAAGGGGGGQLLIMSLGDICLGAGAKLQVNGGQGNGGESLGGINMQISGSGGGSGGHVVLHTASRLDLSALDIGHAQTAADVSQLEAVDLVQAIGGRRGWCASNVQKNGTLADGNSQYMIGRGGAGGDGCIQIHVANLEKDILWPLAAAAGIQDYLNQDSHASHNVDRVEEVLDFICQPKPFSLIPFYSSVSQVQSKWVDTGLAYLRTEEPFLPDYATEIGPAFNGTDADGWVMKDGVQVMPLPDLTAGPMKAVTLNSYEMRLHTAAAFLDAIYLRTPNLLRGYELRLGEQAYEISNVAYDRSADRLDLATRPADGPLNDAGGSILQWRLRPKFLGVITQGQKDFLPASAGVRIEFQGTSDPQNPAAYKPEPAAWATDPEVLRGCRFWRYRLSFEMDAEGVGLELSSLRPQVEYLKVPFAW